jgi:hypothetical protein
MYLPINWQVPSKFTVNTPKLHIPSQCALQLTSTSRCQYSWVTRITDCVINNEIRIFHSWTIWTDLSTVIWVSVTLSTSLNAWCTYRPCKWLNTLVHYHKMIFRYLQRTTHSHTCTLIRTGTRAKDRSSGITSPKIMILAYYPQRDQRGATYAI